MVVLWRVMTWRENHLAARSLIESQCVLSGMAGEGPEGKCGYMIGSEIMWQLESKEFEITDNWGWEGDTMHCKRDTWNDHDQCIWHVNAVGKTANELAAESGGNPKRLDGAYLRKADLVRTTLKQVALWGADLRGANLTGGNFTGANLYAADLRDADLTGANLTDSRLESANLTGADLSGADLTNSDLSAADLTEVFVSRGILTEANLKGADLSDANFLAADLTDVDLRNATLIDAEFRGTDIGGANLANAYLTTATLTDASLTNTNLEGATLTEADLGGADLIDTRIYDTQLRDAYVNEATEFGNSGFETDALAEASQADTLPDDARLSRLRGWLRNRWIGARRWWYFARLDPDDGPSEQFEKAASNYRTIRRLHEENDVPGGIAPFTTRARNADRRQALAEHRWGRWLWLAGARWTSGYGESPRRVVGTSLAVILGCALLYPAIGGVAVVGDGTFQGPTWLKGPYFSVVTFTTLGYGDVQPVGQWAQLLAMAESLVGAALLALLVAVLARRITR